MDVLHHRISQRGRLWFLRNLRILELLGLAHTTDQVLVWLHLILCSTLFLEVLHLWVFVQLTCIINLRLLHIVGLDSILRYPSKKWVENIQLAWVHILLVRILMLLSRLLSLLGCHSHWRSHRIEVWKEIEKLILLLVFWLSNLFWVCLSICGIYQIFLCLLLSSWRSLSLSWILSKVLVLLHKWLVCLVVLRIILLHLCYRLIHLKYWVLA